MFAANTAHRPTHSLYVESAPTDNCMLLHTEMRQRPLTSDNEREPPITSKGMVFVEKVTNNFFLDGKYKMKLLVAFFPKTFRFVARPEFNFRSPRLLK